MKTNIAHSIFLSLITTYSLSLIAMGPDVVNIIVEDQDIILEETNQQFNLPVISKKELAQPDATIDTIYIGQLQACRLNTTEKSPYKKIVTWPANPCICLAGMAGNDLFVAHVDASTRFESVGNFIAKACSSNGPINITLTTSVDKFAYENDTADKRYTNKNPGILNQSLIYGFKNQHERISALLLQINNVLKKYNKTLGTITAYLTPFENLLKNRPMLSLGIAASGPFVYESITKTITTDEQLNKCFKNINVIYNAYQAMYPLLPKTAYTIPQQTLKLYECDIDVVDTKFIQNTEDRILPDMHRKKIIECHTK